MQQVMETVGRSWRSRFFEYRPYRTILNDYFKRDPLFRWEAAPRPLMTDDHDRVVSPTRAYLLSSVSAQLGCVHPSKASWPIMAVGFWFICAALGV